MAQPKKAPTQEPVKVRSCTLTSSTEQTLQQLSQDASDLLGWTVSMSAVVRGLLRYVKQQPPTWAQENIFPQIEQEIAAGRVWGKKVS